MTHDIEVYGTRCVSAEQFAAVVVAAGGSVDDSLVVHRLVRGKTRRVLVVDGPLDVDREDLPSEVAASVVGARVLYVFTVEDPARATLAFAVKAARGLAEIIQGVVHDRQNDRNPIWPSTSRRRFKPPAVKDVDLVDLTWYIRREDMPPDLPVRVLDLLRTWFPEAMPHRFGGSEPLQHKLSDGKDGFIRAWRAESSGLDWSTGAAPFYSGNAHGVGDNFTPYLIGEEEQQTGLPHPVASFSLSLDLSALSDSRWRNDLVAGFARIGKTTGAFYAHAAVERNWERSGRSLRTGGRTQTNEFPVSRNRWMGLPPYPIWLAWFKGFYADHIELYLTSTYAVSDNGDDAGVLWRAADHPDQARPGPWPDEYSMNVITYATRSPDIQPARVIPHGLS